MKDWIGHIMSYKMRLKKQSDTLTVTCVNRMFHHFHGRWKNVSIFWRRTGHSRTMSEAATGCEMVWFLGPEVQWSRPQSRPFYLMHSDVVNPRRNQQMHHEVQDQLGLHLNIPQRDGMGFMTGHTTNQVTSTKYCKYPASILFVEGNSQ